ncbi:hypothetical protein [Nocardia carnea]|uniref:hypothetical protein n=1 Tax=Nocardia carnea TaxID=37328 RepID=UPI0024572FAE|nr:hypothetical protein [Nocardia carnea]
MEFDEAAQRDPSWQLFARPERISEQIDLLFTQTLPTVPIGGEHGWTTPAERTVGPMPQGVDRYSDEMTLYWIEDVFDYFFPDEDALTDPSDPLMVDQWVCYIGNYFVQHCGGKWVNVPELADGALYGYGPSIVYDWTDTEIDFPVDLLYTAVEDADFQHVTQEWYSRSVDYAEVHGLPHEQLELEKKLGIGRWRPGGMSNDTASGWDQEMGQGAESTGIAGENQLTMDFGEAIERTHWGKWVDPDRHAAQVQKFLNHAGLQRMPSKLWPENSPDLHQINNVCRGLFPDSDTPYRPENQDMTDTFICFLGACFKKYVDGAWVDHTEYGHDKSFYHGGLNPALRWIDYDGDEDECTVFDYIDSMIDHNLKCGDGFIHITDDLRRKYYNLM